MMVVPRRRREEPGADVIGGKVREYWGVAVCRWPRLLVGDAVVIVTHPLLAAALRGRGEAGAGAVGDGAELGAEGHAPHHATHAAALVGAAGPKVLAVLVDTPVVLTGESLGVR